MTSKTLKIKQAPKAKKVVKENNYDLLKVLSYGKTKYFNKEETIDVNALNFIVQNGDIFDPLLIRREVEDEKLKAYDPLLLASKYLEKSRKGVVKVQYKQKRGVGRVYAVKGQSLQAITRQIRQVIGTSYVDIDMVNAHPNLLKFICDENGFPCPILTKYCENRDQFFKDNNLTKAVGKIVFLAVMNGGTKKFNELEDPSEELIEFKETEIRNIHDLIANKHRELYEDHKKARIAKDKKVNHKASFMNIILCDIENKILQVVNEFFGSPNNVVWCFDGLMLEKGKEYDLRGCEAEIFKKLKIPINLMVKPFEDALDLSEYTYSDYEDLTYDYFPDYKKLVNKENELENVTEWLNNSISLIENGGANFILTKNKSIDCITNLERIYYQHLNIEDFQKGIDVECNIINPEYDEEYYLEHRDDPVRKQRDLNQEKMKKYLYTNLYKKGNGHDSFVTKMMRTRKMKCFNNVNFIPYLDRNGKPKMHDCFNMFGGFPMDRIDQDLKNNKDFTKSLLYKHILEELMNNDQKEMDHFMDHIADMIQDPANIKTNGHLFYTKQGMGKGLLAEFMSMLLGSEHVISFENTEAYFGQFNADHGHKILKIFEEVSDKGAAFKNHDRLKGDQSKKRERIEEKGKDAYAILHCARFWYYTNNPNALFIEGDDRRFTCHRANNRYANNLKYFEPIWAEIRDIQFCRSAFEFFATRKYTFESVSKCYDNDYKKEQKISNLSCTQQFLKEHVEDGFKVKHDGDKVRCTDLNEAYNVWCTTSNTPFKLKTFKTQLAKFEIKEVNCMFEGKKTRCYEISPEILRVKFSDFLRDPEFKFDILDEDEDNDENVDLEPEVEIEVPVMRKIFKI